MWLGAGLAIEAEILYLSGVFLGLPFLRRLGNIGFALSLGRLLMYDVPSDRIVSVTQSRSIHSFTPAALFQAMLFYINRLLRPNAAYSTLAAALLASVFGAELPVRFVGTGWIVFAIVLLEIGIRRLRAEFRFQAYALAAAGVFTNIWVHFSETQNHHWIPLGCALLCVYALVIRLRAVQRLQEVEQKYLDFGGGAAITTLSLLLVWQVAPVHYKGFCSCALAVALCELGARRLPATLTRFSYVCAAIASVMVIVEATPYFSKFASSYVWISYVGVAACLYFLAERAGKKQYSTQVIVSSTAVLFAMCVLWLILPNVAVASAWAAVSLVLFALGRYRDRLHERWQAYLLIVAAVVNAWEAGLPLATLMLVCACYLAQLIAPTKGEHFPPGWLGYVEGHPRTFWSLLGTFSLSALLWQQFPGGLLTTAWGIEGLTLLITGFPLRQRNLRLEGLALLFICILKLFLYDLRNLETLYRILSFVALGIILLGVSSIYTRFGEHVRRCF